MWEQNRSRNDKKREYWNRYNADLNGEGVKAAKNSGSQDDNPEPKQAHAFEKEIVDNRINWALGKAFDITFYEDTPEPLIKSQSETINRFYRMNNLNVSEKMYAKYLLACGESCKIMYKKGEAKDIGIFIPEPFNIAYTKDREGNLSRFARRYVVQESINNEVLYVPYEEEYTDTEIITRKGQPDASLGVAEKCEVFDLQNDGYSEVDRVPHDFGKIPVILTQTDECGRPAYYPVIRLIDAYNNLFTEATNQFRAFRSAYLVLKNYIMTDEDDAELETDAGRNRIAEKLRTIRAFFIDNDGDVKFLTREVQQEAFVAIKKALEENIDRFSGNINYSNPEVLGKATNLTINTRTKPIDNASNDLADILEVSVKDMLAICNGIWEKVNSAIDIVTVKVNYYYDKPANLPEEAQSVQTLVNAGVTLEDALSVTSFVENPAEWAERSKEENKIEPETYDIIPPEDDEE
jgi:SPP1 family phage portal protein